MNRIQDEEQWALGRDAIEHEKAAARAWLARRDGPVAPIAHARKPRFWVWRRIRWITVTCTVLVLAAVLLVRWEGASRPPKGVGPTSVFLRAFEDARAEGPALEPEDIHFKPAGMTDFAWSIQQVLCRTHLADETSGALASLIENALLKTRAKEKPWREPVLREPIRPTRFSRFFSQVYKSIREG